MVGRRSPHVWKANESREIGSIATAAGEERLQREGHKAQQGPCSGEASSLRTQAEPRTATSQLLALKMGSGHRRMGPTEGL